MTTGTPGQKNLQKRFLKTIHRVFERDNSLSKCCAVRALERMESHDGISKKWLVDLLIDPDADVRMDAAAALGRMRVEEAVQPLLSSLTGDPEGEVRIQAVMALSRIASGETVEPLINCLKEDGYPHLDLLTDDVAYGACWEVQSQALNALGEIGDRRATETVIDLLESADYEDLQESGYRVIAKLDGDVAREFLLGHLANGTALARRRAARALGSLPELASGTGEIPPQVLEGLLNALLDKEPRVRAAAAVALGGASDPSIIVPLTLLLADADADVREEVAVILGRMRGRDVIDRLHELLEDSKLELKGGIVRVLGEIGAPESFEPLSRMLDTANEDLLLEVLRAIEKIGQPGAEEQIAAVIANHSAGFPVRVQAAMALGTLFSVDATAKDGDAKGDDDGGEEPSAATPSPLEILRAAVFDENETVVFAALSSLVKIDAQAAPQMLAGLVRGDHVPATDDSGDCESGEEETLAVDGAVPKQEEDQDAALSLAAGGDPQASTLASILAASVGEAEVVENAEEKATTTGEHESGEEVATTDDAGESDGKLDRESDNKSGAGSRIDAVRIHAARLLGGIAAPGPEAVAALMELAGENAPELRREALLSLGRIGDKEAFEVIPPALEATQLEVRLAALEALGGLNAVSEMNGSLALLLGDTDPFVREMLIRALAKCPNADTAGHLYHAMEDEDLGVCRAALESLAGGVECEGRERDDAGEPIVRLMFRFGGELRREAGAALGRLHDESRADELLGTLDDDEREEFHWICIDALAEICAHGDPAGSHEHQEGNRENVRH